MRLPVYILCLLTLSFCVACGKIDLEENKEDETEQPTDTPDDEPIAEGDTLTVAQALRADSGSYVYVVGYYVGYIQNNKYYYGVPSEASNANMLLADDPGETDNAKTFVVSLGAKTSIDRADLNLYDHPEYLGKRLGVEGQIETYYRKNGLKNYFFGWWWAEEEADDDEGGSGSDNGGITGGDGGTTGGEGETTTGDTTKTPTPTTKDTAEVVPSGR